MRVIQPSVEPGDHMLEAGLGEGTTLAGVMKEANRADITALGSDVSGSRIRGTPERAKENTVDARLFVGMTVPAMRKKYKSLEIFG